MSDEGKVICLLRGNDNRTSNEGEGMQVRDIFAERLEVRIKEL